MKSIQAEGSSPVAVADPPDMLRRRMAGVFVPISTPFTASEEVDFDALTFNLERYAASGVLGYLALGSNGENRSLTSSLPDSWATQPG